MDWHADRRTAIIDKKLSDILMNQEQFWKQILEWKKHYSDKYAALLEGARRVGKSTIAESFAQNEYKSYILIDFSKTTNNIRECFDDIGNLNVFFFEAPGGNRSDIVWTWEKW